MKQTRRQELKTNTLSVYLSQIYERAQLYSNYITGGLVVVLLVLVVGAYLRHSRQVATQNGWKRFYEIVDPSDDAGGDVDLITRAERLADEYAGHRQIGLAARELQADLTYEEAMKLSPVGGDRGRRVELLKSARRLYQELLDGHAREPLAAARLRMSLAACIENLVLLDEARADEAQALYQQVAADPASPFKPLAEKMAQTLATRVAPLKIVATRPAETAPEGAAASAAGPETSGTAAAPVTVP